MRGDGCSTRIPIDLNEGVYDARLPEIQQTSATSKPSGIARPRVAGSHLALRQAGSAPQCPAVLKRRECGLEKVTDPGSEELMQAYIPWVVELAAANTCSASLEDGGHDSLLTGSQ